MKSRKKIYLSLIIFIGLSVFLIFFVIQPLFQKIQELSADVLNQKSNAMFFEQSLKNLVVQKNLYQSYQPNLEKINQLFVNKEFPVEFISFLEESAKKDQLAMEISSMTAEKKETDPWSSFVFQIKVTGSFPDLMKFMAKLENIPYLTEVQNFKANEISSGKAKTEKTKEISADFLVKVYSK